MDYLCDFGGTDSELNDQHIKMDDAMLYQYIICSPEQFTSESVHRILINTKILEGAVDSFALIHTGGIVEVGK